MILTVNAEWPLATMNTPPAALTAPDRRFGYRRNLRIHFCDLAHDTLALRGKGGQLLRGCYDLANKKPMTNGLKKSKLRVYFSLHAIPSRYLTWERGLYFGSCPQ
jgi:hypothetical protein